ncbi:MAG TPA: uroporphyrinogen-III synthase [Thermoanaerobaculia bacterium]|nr:uroporphyrinogen-III synthase [Thermoanaerobaculia bacterium]
MSSPRALVVRSGANPFIQLAPSERLEIVEKVSHTIAPMQPPGVMIESGAKYVVFTSQVSVERAFGDPSLGPLFRKIAEGARAVAVGAATAQALASQGVTADVVAGGSSESILERLPARLDGQRILLPCGEDAPLELQEKLRSRGARVARLVLYRKVPVPKDDLLEMEIVNRPFAAFCTTSPSAAAWLFSGLSETASNRLRSTPAVVLGRFTRRFLESHGVSRIEMTEEARFSEAVKLLEHLAAGPAGT